MTEENKAAGGAATPDTGAGVPATKPDAVKEPSNADRAARRITRERDNAIAEAAKLKAQLAEIENSKKTEHEKAIEQARTAASKETEDRMRAEVLHKDIRSEARLALAEAGVPANQVAVVLDEYKPETVDEAKAAAAEYAGKWAEQYGKAPPPKGQSGAPSTLAPSAVSLGDISSLDKDKFQAALPDLIAKINEERGK